jgi:ABC-type uncharacterized transport system auxiliary subunit
MKVRQASTELAASLAMMGVVLGGCAAEMTAADMTALAARATAETLGPDVATTAITVSDVRKTPTSSSWIAETPRGRVACTGNEKFLLPVCEPSAS